MEGSSHIMVEDRYLYQMSIAYTFFSVHCLYRLPREGSTLLVHNEPPEKQQWKHLHQNIINSMCRDVRNKERKHQEN